MQFTRSELAGKIDHTLLRPDALPDDIVRLCGEAKYYGFASVCVNPCYISTASKELAGSPVAVCSVIGFPLGASAPLTKALEAASAVRSGAAELDVVINIGFLKGGLLDLVSSDLTGVVESARLANQATVVKIILETCLLTEKEKMTACRLAVESGADFVKTSTGWGKSGATIADVALLKQTVGASVGVKASGGIRDLAAALSMLEAGAARIGTSSGPAIINELIK
ncbi:deoxyribose-phosphate aldolase [Pelotomaculum propionicicum]|uniref:deoxyribose-phosphate aldolase n=1 Tax=Pelotomaculum propionicicum TaxID=258475 RepID=UPI003B7B82ED